MTTATTDPEISHPTQPTLEVPELARLPREELTTREIIDSLPFLGISLAYHRYFAHRTFKTSRPFQFLLAFWAMTSAQKGVLWWAGHHRNHHRYTDMPGDPHSPARSGFFWSHMGWILSHRNADMG